MKRRENHYNATEETLLKDGLYGIVHVYEDIHGEIHDDLLDLRFNTMQEALRVAKELNEQNRDIG